MNPLVSIIIPCFNHGCYLGDAVRSVLQQTYAPIEIIVVDDGSTDDTAKVAHSFGAAIRYVKKQNGGLSSARNKGIECAKGEFLGFLDADDCFYPTKIEKQVHFFADHPELGLVFCGWKLVRDGDFVVLSTEIPHDQHDFSDELLTHSLFHVTCVLICRIAIERMGRFDEQLTSCEDRDYWLRAAQRGVKFGCVPEVFMWIRDRADSNQ